MIRHLALFTLNPEIADADREALMDRIRGFRRLKCVRRMELSRLLKPREPWYVPRMSADFEYLLMIEFEDEDKLYEFQTDRYHLEVGGDLRRRATTVKVMDFTAGTAG
jgi:Stress responsive A/B Barrel Domain